MRVLALRSSSRITRMKNRFLSCRRECSWEPPPEATLESPSWASWSTQSKGGDTGPPTLETPASQEGEWLVASAETVDGTVVVDEVTGGVAPREGVALGGGDAASGGRKDGSSAVVPSAAISGAAAGSDLSFHGASTDKSGVPAGSEQRATDVEVCS